MLKKALQYAGEGLLAGGIVAFLGALLLVVVICFVLHWLFGAKQGG
ncbi:MAG TPA: hypothetical protein VMC43_02705 [Candidatus Paceibacterota bacterium]|nr:hypothetical protein [Candidatus Paceibacterota bacterium]